MHTTPALPGWHHAPQLDREHAARAVGPILGHPTKPNLRFFTDAGEGAGGAGATGGTGGAAGAAGAAGGTGGEGTGGAGSTGNPPAGTAAPAPTADDLAALRAQADRRMQERNAARDEAKAFKDLGLTVEEIAQLKADRDAKNGGPTPDQIRAQAQRDADKAAAERYASKARASAVREAATALGFHDPKDALALLDPKAVADVAVEDDEADSKAVGALLADLAKARPYLVKTTAPQTADWRTAGIGGTGGAARPDPKPGTPRLEAAYAASSQNRR